MKKFFHLYAIIILGLISSATAFAETPRHTQIAVIDSMYISQNSIAMKDAREHFDKLMAKYQKVTKKISEEIAKKNKILKSQESFLKPEDFKNKKDEFEKGLAQKQKQLYEERQYLDKLYEQAEIIFANNIKEIIKDIAKDKDYVVIDKASVYYCDGSIDISNQIVNELNNRMKKINFDVEKNDTKDF